MLSLILNDGLATPLLFFASPTRQAWALRPVLDDACIQSMAPIFGVAAGAADCADASVCGPPPICSVLAAMRSHHSSTYGRTSPQRTAMDSPNRFGTPNHTRLHTAHHTQEPQAPL